MRAEIRGGEISEKKYPTRMHEVLGVQTKEMFALNVGLDNPNYYLTDDGDMFMRYGTANKTIRMAHADEVLDAINHGITRHPRLTEEAQEKEDHIIRLERMRSQKDQLAKGKHAHWLKTAWLRIR